MAFDTNRRLGGAVATIVPMPNGFYLAVAARSQAETGMINIGLCVLGSRFHAGSPIRNCSDYGVAGR